MVRRVLLVEDSLPDARIVQHRLRAAASGAEEWRLERVGALASAIDRLGKQNLDVVLLDLGLPDSQGLETLARLRQHGGAIRVDRLDPRGTAATVWLPVGRTAPQPG